MSDISDQIETNAAQPKSASFDGNSATQHSLQEQIEADRYLRELAAQNSPKRGFSIAKLKPPGAV